jgi:hypothetical protein
MLALTGQPNPKRRAAVIKGFPAEIRRIESPDGVRYRLPAPPYAASTGARELALKNDGTLEYYPQVQPFPFAATHPVADLRRLVVSPEGLGAVLWAETRAYGQLRLLADYPEEWLLVLADDLAGRCGLASEFGPSVPLTVPMREKQLARSRAPVGEPLEQPVESRVAVERRGTGVTLNIPPGGPGPLYLIGLVLCGFAAVFSLPLVCAGPSLLDAPWGALLFIFGFWAVAGGVFLRGYHNAHLRTAATVVGDELSIETAGPLGTTRQQWSRAQVADIRCGETEWAEGEDNPRPIIQLQIHLTEGKKIGLCTCRREEELRWMADVLRRALWPPQESSV